MDGWLDRWVSKWKDGMDKDKIEFYCLCSNEYIIFGDRATATPSIVKYLLNSS